MSKVPDRARPTITTRLGVSLPTAVGALLFAGAVAFGSGLTGMPSPGHSPNKDSTTSHADKGGDYQGTGGLNPREDSDVPKPPYAPKPPKPEQQPEPDQPKPEQPPAEQPKAEYQPKPDKPQPPAPSGPMQLQAASGIGKVKLTWSTYTGGGFGYYKVVRSTDATVSWPAGAGDTLVGAISDPYMNYFKDFPPCGTTFSYAVFAVSGGDHQKLAASNTVSAAAQCEEVKEPPPPHPDPTVLGFALTLVEGGVALEWEMCTGDGFIAYKIVRSQTNPDPTFPLNAGTELATVVGNSSVTSWTDTNVMSGQTWFYRVVSVGSDASGWYPLGVTPVLTVTVP
jgi:hypothetical protein